MSKGLHLGMGVGNSYKLPPDSAGAIFLPHCRRPLLLIHHRQERAWVYTDMGVGNSHQPNGRSDYSNLYIEQLSHSDRAGCDVGNADIAMLEGGDSIMNSGLAGPRPQAHTYLAARHPIYPS